MVSGTATSSLTKESKPLRLTKEVLGFELVVTAAQMGEDWLVTVTGGDTPHIGTTSFAWMDEGELVLKSLVCPTHKDHIVGEHYARTLAPLVKSRVLVVAGIHYDGITTEHIAHVVEASSCLLNELVHLLSLHLQQRDTITI